MVSAPLECGTMNQLDILPFALETGNNLFVLVLSAHKLL